MTKNALNLVKTAVKEAKDKDELCLDQIEIGEITQEIANELISIEDLAYLSMNSCSLKNLNNFPELPNLIHLELSSNNLIGKDLENIKGMNQLQSLILSNNKIEKLSELKPLNKLPLLIQLELLDNPVTEDKDYRTNLFENIKSLQFLDKLDAEGNQFEYTSEDEYNDEEDFDEDDEEENDDEDEEDEEDEEDDEDDDDDDESA